MRVVVKGDWRQGGICDLLYMRLYLIQLGTSMFGHSSKGDGLSKPLSLSARRNTPPEHEQYHPRDFSAHFKDSPRFDKPSSEYSLRNDRKPFEASETKRLPTRKQNEVISNLRNELKNIKSEVSKLMNKEELEFPKVSRKEGVQSSREDWRDKFMYTPSRRDRVGDNSSTSSFLVSKDRPRQKIFTEGEDKSKYFQLQNQILRSELKNLKSKYVLRKSEYKGEIDTLNKKIFLLQGIIASNEDELSHYKAEIENEIVTIRKDMVTRTHSHSQGSELFDETSTRSDRDNEAYNLRQEVSYLRRRVEESVCQLKRMAVENDLLSGQLRDAKRDVECGWKQQLQVEHDQRMKQRDQEIQNLRLQLEQMSEKQEIAHQVVKKNADLIETLNTERENINVLVAQLEQLKLKESENKTKRQDHDSLLEKYTGLLLLHESLSQENTLLREEILQLRDTNQQLSHQMIQTKRYVSEMVLETAHKINSLEMTIHTLTAANDDFQHYNHQLRMALQSKESIPEVRLFHRTHLQQDNSQRMEREQQIEGLLPIYESSEKEDVSLGQEGDWVPRVRSDNKALLQEIHELRHQLDEQ